jgi:hypothetical protein
MREVYSNHRRTKGAQLETRATNGASDIKRPGASRHSLMVDELMDAADREVHSFTRPRTLSQNLLFRTVVKKEILGEQPGRFIGI